MNKIKETIEKQKEEFKKELKCINDDCNNNGTIAERDGEGDWQPAQCEYCYKIRFPLIEKFSQSQSEIIETIKKEVIDVIRKHCEDKEDYVLEIREVENLILNLLK